MANPVVVVTGVGPGTGAAIARRFSRGGYTVAMLARSRDRLIALERESESARAYPCDVTDEAGLEKTLDAVRADLGTPKVLVHNAVGGAFGDFLQIAPEVGPKGVQVVYVMLDAVIDLEWTRQMFPNAPDEFFIKPAAIAEEVWHVAHQDRSAWSFNVELRP